MKRFTLNLAAFVLACFYMAFQSALMAQAPQTIPYQAVARDSSGNLLVNKKICVQFGIYSAPSSGTLLYEEHDTVTTNSLGLFTLSLGQGTYDGGSDTSLGSLNWSSTGVYVATGLDLTGTCSGYVPMGKRTQMQSVPYALYASSAGTATSVSGTTPSGGIIMYSGAWNFDGTGLGTGALLGWALCNGNNGTPDLAEQFIMGAANNSELSATGGAATHTHAIPALTVPALSIPAEDVTGTIPALAVPSLAITGTIPALAVPSLDITGTIPALAVPSLDITGTIPALAVPSLAITGTIPALAVPSLAITGTIPALGVPSLAISGTIPALTLPSLTISGTIPGISVPLGDQVVDFVGSATVSNTDIDAAGYIGWNAAAGGVMEVGLGNSGELGTTENITGDANPGSGTYTWKALQLQSPTVTSTVYTLGTGPLSTSTGQTTTATALAASHISTTAANTTATALTGGNISTTAANTTATALTGGNISTTAANTTATALTGGNISTTAANTTATALAASHISTTAANTTATALTSGNISTTAASTTAYALSGGSLTTGATSTGTGTTAGATSGSASSLPPYLKLAFIMKQ